MATIEMNMLSVITCGSISVRVFCPGMDKLYLDDADHMKKYPVIWLLHTDGGAALDWLSTPAERIAEEYGVFLIAPDQHHALCTNMKYGPRYEHFLNTELPGICRNSLPLSDDPNENWVVGVGTGGYGAVKMALKHPETFSAAVALNGVLDMQSIIDRALKREDTGIRHDQASLEAVFGDLSAFSGSENDLYTLAEQPEPGRFLFAFEADCATKEDSLRLAKVLGRRAQVRELEAGADLDSCQRSLWAAAEWLVKGAKA